MVRRIGKIYTQAIHRFSLLFLFTFLLQNILIILKIRNLLYGRQSIVNDSRKFIPVYIHALILYVHNGLPAAYAYTYGFTKHFHASESYSSVLNHSYFYMSICRTIFNLTSWIFRQVHPLAIANLRFFFSELQKYMHQDSAHPEHSICTRLWFRLCAILVHILRERRLFDPA